MNNAATVDWQPCRKACNAAVTYLCRLGCALTTVPPTKQCCRCQSGANQHAERPTQKHFWLRDQAAGRSTTMQRASPTLRKWIAQRFVITSRMVSQVTSPTSPLTGARGLSCIVRVAQTKRWRGPGGRAEDDGKRRGRRRGVWADVGVALF